MEKSIKITYFSGYIRNWQKLCDELEIALPLSREERENAILTKGFEKWGTGVVDHLYGAFVFAVEDGESAIASAITSVRSICSIPSRTASCCIPATSMRSPPILAMTSV